MSESRTSPPPFPWLGFFRLLRIPNVFTAWSDTLMAWLVAHGAFPNSGGEIAALTLLLGATTGLYLGGMVLNDWFDFAEDQMVRAFRPLPSGQFSTRFAARLGFGLLAAGVVLAAAAGVVWGQSQAGNAMTSIATPLIMAVCLVLLILAYNGMVKRTPGGPVAMGACRTANIMLGMSLALPIDSQTGKVSLAAVAIAQGIGFYIIGVTWFARREESQSPRGGLVLGLCVMLIGISLLAFAPDFGVLPKGRLLGANYRWLMLLVGGVIAIRCLRAIADPRPAKVQLAIKIAILSLIWLDAAIALRVSGVYEAALIAALLIPALLIGRAVYST
jgi:4-hydroxybenzoate polyprenyltransferase